jgi:hypothetical protein
MSARTTETRSHFIDTLIFERQQLFHLAHFLL